MIPRGKVHLDFAKEPLILYYPMKSLDVLSLGAYADPELRPLPI